MDMLMEVDRLKELQQREQTEEARRVKRLDDRAVIVEQMRGREKYKMLLEEEREQENQAMLALMKRYQDEDTASAEKRSVEVKRSREEVMAANAQAIKRKELAKLQDKQEEESILAYQAKKDADIARREYEEAEKARMAKERQAKLLAMQEKTQNKQAELDELRARRHQEEKERRERERCVGSQGRPPHTHNCVVWWPSHPTPRSCSVGPSPQTQSRGTFEPCCAAPRPRPRPTPARSHSLASPLMPAPHPPPTTHSSTAQGAGRGRAEEVAYGRNGGGADTAGGPTEGDDGA